jgi:topoisomerase-4 subunit A
MRYTEARLTPVARLLLDELDEGTVDFQPNYDGTAQEPQLLPARLPMVLLNGASGIAVGLATEIPSHNLRDIARAAVALIRDPKLSDDELHALVPGPDFPGGGQIISSPAELKAVYQTGRGSLKVRARWSIEELARGQWQVVVHELPPGTSGQKVLEDIEELTNPTIKAGKKSLSAEQLQLKQTMLGLLDTVRDESGKAAPVRLVFAPKSKNVAHDTFMTTLLAHTSLESSVSMNLVMIGRDGRPRQKNLRDILSEWIAFRFDVVTRRTRFRLDKVNDRIHLLEGRMTAFLHIDQVIRLIREADEPKEALMQTFSLSPRQAEDILEIRLRQLARLEGLSLERELEDKRAEKNGLEELLAQPGSMKKQIIKEIDADAKQFGDARRTLIQEEKKSVADVKVVDEPVTVIVSHQGWLRARQGHGHDPAAWQFKAGDHLYRHFACRTVDTLLALADNGRVYSVPVSQLPGARGDGQPVTSFIDLESGSRLVHFYAGASTETVLVATSEGYGFSAQVGDMTSRQRAGKSFLNLDPDAQPLALMRIHPEDNALACLNTGGRLLIFGVDELKQLSGGGRGVILQQLQPQEHLLSALPIHSKGVRIRGTYGGKEKIITLNGAALAPYLGKRARPGKLLEARLKAAELLPLG